MTEEYKQGYVAYTDGIELHENPYHSYDDEDVRYFHWYDGWKMAEATAESEGW